VLFENLNGIHPKFSDENEPAYEFTQSRLPDRESGSRSPAL